MSCNVCDGTPGLYPIMDKFGSELYSIRCPECAGTGLTDDEVDLERRAARDLVKYNAAMDEMRAKQMGTGR
jgi:hypothetical protein